MIPAQVEDQRSPRRRLCLFATFLVVTVALDLWRGAFSADLCGWEDEPAHVVTGIMFRDWILAGCPSPMAFAEDYYLHYPKVAIGQWPPVFYGVQALWTLVFGASTVSLVLLMACLTAGVASLIHASLRHECGPGAAICAGLLWLALPLVQAYGAMVMTEVVLALLCFGAVLAFGRFLDGGRRRDLVCFAALAVLACLTKGNALALALLPPLATLLAGRWDRWRRRDLWVAGGAVALIVAPWYALTLGITQSTWVGGGGPSGSYASAAVTFFGRELVRLGGWAFLVAAAYGAVRSLAVSADRGRVAAVVAWPPSLLLVHGLVPSSLDARHLVLLAPALVWLGVRALATHTPSPRRRAVAAVVLLGAVLIERGEVPAKAWQGYSGLARELAQDEVLDGRAILIVSDVSGEGAFVAALAQAGGGDRPAHLVFRASKALARSDWVGRDYELRFESVAELATWLDEVPVAAIVQDRAPLARQRFPHHELVAEALLSYPDRWVREAPRDVTKDGVEHPSALVVWRRRGQVERPVGQDLTWLLGREVPRQ
ncbi:MAG: glycosyltransferase family 39 protein [Planctomycetota bacterium]|nr:glycosyltransferase family 39 protein [Planctomycetota bacterium]